MGGVWQGVLDGAAGGFMMGAITGAVTGGIRGFYGRCYEYSFSLTGSEVCNIIHKSVYKE
ncbi:MAG: hypothetical protein LBK69_02575 [Syntrophomonadaceae bacterium]|nr:hypothetical protein [Syntrophomonadaceae bacterium]